MSLDAALAVVGDVRAMCVLLERASRGLSDQLDG